jgi:transposase
MRAGITITVSSADRRRLEAVVKDSNAAQKHVGRSKTCVWRWQERFMQDGVEGLLRDKTRPSRIAPLGDVASERVVDLTRTDPPGETTHWTGAMMAKAAGISVSSVQRTWRALGLQPHRVRQFKLSNDPQFVDKLRDVVALYVGRRRTPSCCRSTRRARSRRSTAPSRDCR